MAFRGRSVVFGGAFRLHWQHRSSCALSVNGLCKRAVARQRASVIRAQVGAQSRKVSTARLKARHAPC